MTQIYDIVIVGAGPAGSSAAHYLAQTGLNVLVWVAGALGAVGLAFTLIGFFWPTAVHLF